MHYHLEIIMPPTDDVKAAVEHIMAPFNEQGEDEDGYPNSHTFWDWWQLGGRWSGSKLEANVGNDKIAEFRQMLADKEFTVSGIQFGKQELSPADQIPEVDRLWREWFPDSGLDVCPLFQHSQKLEIDGMLPGDVMRLEHVPQSLSCAHIIFAAPSYNFAAPSYNDGVYNGPLEAEQMLQTRIWNGVTYQETKWDGTLAEAMELMEDRCKHLNPKFVEVCKPQPNWLVVTVDYHC